MSKTLPEQEGNFRDITRANIKYVTSVTRVGEGGNKKKESLSCDVKGLKYYC